MNTRTVRSRPIPKPTQTTAYFWEAARRGKLALQYDPEARQYQFWPKPISSATGKRNLEWKETSGRGFIYSFTITQVPAAGFEDHGPYIIGLVELDEKVRIIANVHNVKPSEMRIGMRVKVMFERISDDIDYFAFEPDNG